MTASPPPVRILIVDEEDELTHVLSLAIRLEGWDPLVAVDGASAIAAVIDFDPDIVLLDMGLPDMPGTEVVSALRGMGRTVPVVFLTGRAEHEDRVAGFAAGADDYVTKPVGLEELIDHLRPIVASLGLAPSSRRVGDLVLDDEAGWVWRGGEYLSLTPFEYEMLRALAEQLGTQMTVGELLRAAAARGVRVPREMVDRMLKRLCTIVNREHRALISGDSVNGWVLSAA